MSSGRDIRAAEPPPMEMYRRPGEQSLPYIFSDFGGAGEPTRFACGFLGYDARPFNPILGALPRLMHVSAAHPGAELIQDLARAALRESEHPSPGAETILGKLSELVFLQAIRQHLDTLPPDATGWFAGLERPPRRQGAGADARPAGDALDARRAGAGGRPLALDVRRALRRARRDARRCSISPPGDCNAPPIAIGVQGMSIAQAAAEVGYDCEAAFNRAFKKQVGAPPGSWRKARLRGLRQPKVPH